MSSFFCIQKRYGIKFVYIYNVVWELDLYFDNSDTIVINLGDTAYCVPAGNFPLLSKEGLTKMNSSLYDVLVAFLTSLKKCLLFKGDEYFDMDVRKISSYENIGRCDFCVIRAMVEPDGMLYRITDDMLKEAKSCDPKAQE